METKPTLRYEDGDLYRADRLVTEDSDHLFRVLGKSGLVRVVNETEYSDKEVLTATQADLNKYKGHQERWNLYDKIFASIGLGALYFPLAVSAAQAALTSDYSQIASLFENWLTLMIGSGICAYWFKRSVDHRKAGESLEKIIANIEIEKPDQS